MLIKLILKIIITTISLLLLIVPIAQAAIKPLHMPLQENSSEKNKENISLNFQDIKVRAALQLLAESSGVNIIVSDKIQNSMTLHLSNIAWQQVLDIILQSQGLAKRQYGNVLFIAPGDEIAVHEKQQLQTEQQREDLAPLHSELITIHYGKAADIAGLLKTQSNSILSKRGSVSVDTRTNTVWVQDVIEKLIDVRSLIKKLDVPVKQVLIEARIVNIDSNFEEELGVRFGLTYSNQIEKSGANAMRLTGGLDQNLNIDLPTMGIAKPGTTIALARLGKNTLLDLELSALESEGSAQIISKPKLITADQQTATVQAGEEIPYQQEAYGGATNVTFKKAVLSLNVTPQITPDGKVILLLKVNQDKPGVRLIEGVPSIDTREIQTQVLVNNGETIVLGGIYEESQNKQIQRVPFLGSLPVIGGLFRHQQTNNNRKELLIFVTPHICV